MRELSFQVSRLSESNLTPDEYRKRVTQKVALFVFYPVTLSGVADELQEHFNMYFFCLMCPCALW